MMDAALARRVIEAVADSVIAHADELTALDQAIGDGDHGINMKRGFETVRAEAATLAAKPLPEALQAMGMQLVMKVGGASGPLYGTLLMTLGKALSPQPGSADFADASAQVAIAFGQATDAVKARGKSETGQKTMVDVLEPVRRALRDGGGTDLLARLPAVAAEAAQATVPMRAVRGRASFLGDRSIGHMDPGARSCSLMIAAACRALEG
jgi:dihydroxyacetone kinase-like protein